MLFPYDAKNTFVEWAKHKGIVIDANDFKAHKQYAMYSDLEPKVFYPVGVQDQEDYCGDTLNVPVELLADDKATVRTMSRAITDGGCVLLFRFPCNFSYKNKAYYYDFSRANEAVYKGMAKDFLHANIRDYCIVIDRNTFQGYFLTTQAALDDFKGWYAKHMDELRANASNQVQAVADAYDSLARAQETYNAAKAKLTSLENRVIRDSHYGELYKKF